MKASFVVRNTTHAKKERIYQNESVNEAIDDMETVISDLKETESADLADYCTDGFKAAQLQKLIDVGLIAFDSP